MDSTSPPSSGESNLSTQPQSTSNNEASPSIGTSDETIPTVPLEGEALRSALRKQIEYYFSKENLAIDRYLVSQMNADTFVPIQTIANFKMVQNLTTDLDIIKSVMKECPAVVVDDASVMVKPNIKPHRNTLILRDIPSSTPVEEVRAIFEGANCPVPSEVKSDIGDCWYVVFKNDEDALSAIEEIRNRTFKDQPVKARVKTENAFKSLIPGVGSTPVSANAPAFVPNAYYQNTYAYDYGADQQNYRQYEGNRNYRGESGGRGRGGRRGDSNRQPRRDNSGQGRAKGPRNAQQVPSDPAQEGASAVTTTRQRRGSAGLSLTPANFPTLPSSKKAGGYAHEFKKWSRQEIIDLIANIPQPSKPDGIPEVVEIDKPITALQVNTPYPKPEVSTETPQS